jgi:DNA-binding protein H-NS
MVPPLIAETSFMAKRRKRIGRKSPHRGGATGVGNLASMPIEALLKMRDDIGKVLNRRTEQLQGQLAALGLSERLSSKRGASKLKGLKVAPNYRNPKNRTETWAGRGAMPRWMAAAVKAGKKKEDFLISKGK